MIRCALFIVCCVTVAMLCATPAFSQTLSTEQQVAILAEAQQSYDRGVAARRDDPSLARRMFNDAASRYQQLIASGIVNGSLQYNLANAHLQAGDLGRAILHYRAAETLIPGDAALEHNLDYARTLRRSRIEQAGSQALFSAVFGWHVNTSTRSRATIFAMFYILFWVVLFVHLYRSHAAWKWAAVGFGLVWIVLLGSVAIDLAGDDASRIGVVLEDDVVVRKGNGIGFEPQFLETLSEGVEFTVRERRTGWLHIELPDGKSGWIAAESAGLISEALHGIVQFGEKG